VKKMPASTPNGGHRHNRSEYNGRLYDSGTASYPHNHDHSSHQSDSSDYSFSAKSFMRGRPRGESDLGRPPTRKGGESVFSPISENPPATPPPPPPLPTYEQRYQSKLLWRKLTLHSSLLALPEALTAVFLPLPFLFASIAYPRAIVSPPKIASGIAQVGNQQVEGTPPSLDFIHACILSAATLLLVGVLSKLSPLEQTLDRRKSFGNAEHDTSDTLWSSRSLGRMVQRMASIFLPFYAAMHLGGSRTAIVLLTAVAAGIGALDYRPVKHSLLDNLKRTIRTRKLSCSVLLFGITCDFLAASENWSALLAGHLALVIAVVAIPPPLPSGSLPLVIESKDGGHDAPWSAQTVSKLSLPKPVSPLNSSAQDVVITLAAGGALGIFAIVASIISSFSVSVSYHTLSFSSLSIASAAVLFFFSLPSSLKTPKKYGLALGCSIIALSAFFEPSAAWEGLPYISVLSALSFAAVTFDTPTTTSHQHSHRHPHGHSHSHGHKHSHVRVQDHHLHGNHSRLSEFLIKKCTPGSITHSILLEKDSRRIAYFAV